MKKTLILLFLLIPTIASAQCVAEIKDVKTDPDRGSILVETQYTLNGKVVDTQAKTCTNCIGRTRYLETSGTEIEIIQRVKADVKEHCENLIARMATNKAFIRGNYLTRQSELTTPIITNIKSLLVGQTRQIDSVSRTFKGKLITVTYDSKNTITDAP